MGTKGDEQGGESQMPQSRQSEGRAEAERRSGSPQSSEQESVMKSG